MKINVYNIVWILILARMLLGHVSETAQTQLETKYYMPISQQDNVFLNVLHHTILIFLIKPVDFNVLIISMLKIKQDHVINNAQMNILPIHQLIDVFNYVHRHLNYTVI